MKKLVATAPRVAAFADYTDPVVKNNEIKAEVLFASPKHGTEIDDFKATTPFIDEFFDTEWKMFTPRGGGEEKGIKFGDLPLGNMWVGKIIDVGNNVTEFTVGNIVCGYGPIKETQIINAVDNYKLRKVPKDVKYKNAVCYDPAQFALGGVRDGNVRPGDFVAVMGLGAIGQIAVQLVKKVGASVVIAIDPIETRREVAKKYGADYALDPTKCDVGHEMKKLTGKMGCDCIIETSGHHTALQSAFRGLAYGGIISYVAFGKPFPAGLNLGREAHFNNPKIVFSRASNEPSHDYPRWNRKRIEETCWMFLTNGYIDCEEIVQPVVRFEDSAEAYSKYIDTNPELSIKLGVTFQ